MNEKNDLIKAMDKAYKIFLLTLFALWVAIVAISISLLYYINS
jgi:hypothetical protein